MELAKGRAAQRGSEENGPPMKLLNWWVMSAAPLPRMNAAPLNFIQFLFAILAFSSFLLKRRRAAGKQPTMNEVKEKKASQIS